MPKVARLGYNNHFSQIGPEIQFVIISGRYSAWFKTPVGEGAGVVELLPDGRFVGDDTTFSYVGTWAQSGDRVKAAYVAKRIADGPPGVFGMDEIEIIATGQVKDDGTLICTGFAKQAPGLELEVVLIRLEDT